MRLHRLTGPQGPGETHRLALLQRVGDGGVGFGVEAKVAGDRPQSLLWRDAGALSQTLNLTATAYGQAFCALGVLGEQALQAIERPPTTRALGVAMIGTLSDV
jgi:hypothetical protein